MTCVIQPQRRRLIKVVAFISVAFLLASQIKSNISLTGKLVKDFENEGLVDSNRQGNQLLDIVNEESGDSNSSRVSCDSSPCNGFFAYDGPNYDKKAASDILRKAVAQYNYGPERNNATHNKMIFMPNTTNHPSCVLEWKESRLKWVNRYVFSLCSLM